MNYDRLNITKKVYTQGYDNGDTDFDYGDDYFRSSKASYLSGTSSKTTIESIVRAQRMINSGMLCSNRKKIFSKKPKIIIRRKRKAA